MFPYRVVGSMGAVSGCIESNELRNQDHVPFLLSLPAQVKFGMVKNLMKGSVTLPHEDEVELCRCARSGLLVIRIDNFNIEYEQMMPTVRPLHISYTAHVPIMVQKGLRQPRTPPESRVGDLDHSDD